MKFNPNPNADCNLTSASPVDYPKATPDMLKMLFGEPAFDIDQHFGMTDGKTNLEWIFEGEDGTVFTLYDYKGEYPNDDELVTWHVGWDRNGDAPAFQEYLHGLINKYFGEEIAVIEAEITARMKKVYSKYGMEYNA